MSSLARHARLAALWLLLLACLPVPALAAPQAESDIDMVFMVDTSKEMQTHDGGQNRLRVLEAIVELTRGLGSQRVAVMGLARDEADRLLLPLTPLPEDLAAARGVIERALSPVIGGLRSDGDGLTILDSFEELQRQLGERDADSPHLWTVLVTNGDADPLGARGQEDQVNASIKGPAEELARSVGSRTPDREQFKTAAKQQIPAAIPGLLASLGPHTLTIIGVGATGDDKRQVLDPLAANTSGKRVLELTPDTVRQTAVDAIAQAPFPPPSGRTLRSQLSGEQTQRVRILQGTKVARLVLSGAHGDYAANLAPVGGQGPRYSDDGGRAVRSLWMMDPAPAPGEYELTLDNRAGGLGLEARLEFELELAAQVTPPDAGVRAVGSELELGLRLVDFEGQLVSDPHLLTGGRVTLAWTDPSGNPPIVAWDLTGDEPLERTFRHTPQDSSEGRRTYGWRLEAGLLPNASGGFGWNMEAETGSVDCDFSLPSLSLSMVDSDGHVEFDQEGAAGRLTFSTDYLSGGVTQSAQLVLKVDLLGMSEVPVELSFVPSAAHGDAVSAGKLRSTLQIDGQPIGSGTRIVVGPSTAGSILIEVEKSSFGPLGDPLGSLIAVSASGKQVEVPISMGSHIGAMTLLAIALLLLLCFLAWWALRRMARRRAWLALLAGLDDETVLYFEDDEKGVA